MKKNIILVGLGPHSKRIYMNYFKKYNIEPKVLIDLQSNEECAKKYLLENDFKNTIVWTVPDEYKDYEELPKEQRQVQRAIISPFEKNLLFACQLLGLNWQYDNKPNNYIDFTRAKIIFS